MISNMTFLQQTKRHGVPFVIGFPTLVPPWKPFSLGRNPRTPPTEGTSDWLGTLASPFCWKARSPGRKNEAQLNPWADEIRHITFWMFVGKMRYFVPIIYIYIFVLSIHIYICIYIYTHMILCESSNFHQFSRCLKLLNWAKKHITRINRTLLTRPKVCCCGPQNPRFVKIVRWAEILKAKLPGQDGPMEGVMFLRESAGDTIPETI